MSPPKQPIFSLFAWTPLLPSIETFMFTLFIFICYLILFFFLPLSHWISHFTKSSGNQSSEWRRDVYECVWGALSAPERAEEAICRFVPELVPRNTPVTLDGNWNWKQGNFYTHKWTNRVKATLQLTVVSFSFSASFTPPFQEQQQSCWPFYHSINLLSVWVDLCIFYYLFCSNT